jgi:hypothetical protein
MYWLRENCPDVSGRTARFYMQVARNAPKMADLANMTLEEAAKMMADASRKPGLRKSTTSFSPRGIGIDLIMRVLDADDRRAGAP